ncbi:hypothetical protein MSIBF_A120004 [groundwater metagenome]|uniref:Uncharacterized protein n=1 Tax=groundwater metagenome TaxID=717931 RepID=A0A098E5W7_9ZZZZ
MLFINTNYVLGHYQIFIPRGPWANAIISSDSFCTGSCKYKNMGAYIKPSDDDVLECDELIKKYYC